MKTVQRLNDYQSLRSYNFSNLDSVDISLTASNSGWYIVDGPAVMTVTGENYYASSHHVIKIVPTGPGDISLRLDFDESNSPFQSEDIGQRFVFTCVLQCTDGSPSVDAKLCNLSGDCEVGNPRVLSGGYWDAVRSNVMTLETLNYEQDLYGITVTISNHSPNFNPLNITNPGKLSTIYVSTPNIVNDGAWADNPVIQNMRSYIPGFYESYDSKETDPTWPFFRFVDVLTDAIADTMFLYSEWFQHESAEIPSDSGPLDISTRSRLTNYQTVSSEYYPWLAQFSGSKPVKQIYNSAGDEVIQDSIDFLTWQLSPAGYGRGAGTQSAIEQAAKFALTGTKQVVISQRYNAGDGENPWNIRVTTLGSETPDVDYRGSVKVATTDNVNISTALNPGDTVDGVTLEDGDKVLVKEQDTASQNGVYVVSATPSRSADFDTGWNGTTGEIKHGAVWHVDQGNTSGDKSFTTTISGGGNVTVDTTPITFTDFAGSESVLLSVEKARPMGYKIYHTVVDEFTLTLGSSTFGVLGTATL